MPAKLTPAAVGDWLEVSLPGGGPPRRGRVTSVLGGANHEHYVVKWLDEPESIHYPSDGTRVIRSQSEDRPAHEVS